MPIPASFFTTQRHAPSECCHPHAKVPPSAAPFCKGTASSHTEALDSEAVSLTCSGGAHPKEALGVSPRLVLEAQGGKLAVPNPLARWCRYACRMIPPACYYHSQYIINIVPILSFIIHYYPY